MMLNRAIARAHFVTQALIDAEMLGGKVDRLAVESIARYFLESFRKRLALDRSIPMSREERDELRMNTMQEVGNELAAVASDKPFRYPRALPYVLRAFNALEGVGKGLDANYGASDLWKPLQARLRGRAETAPQLAEDAPAL